MRDTSVSDEDLAIQSAKEKLATLKDRPGYAAAMQKVPHGTAARITAFLGAVACAGIIYACTLYVTAAWLRWFFIVIFGILGAFVLFGAIGMSARFAPDHFGVAILEKRTKDNDHFIDFLCANGDRISLSVSDTTYDLLRAGDLGVLKVTGSKPDYSFESFQRL